MSDTQAALLVDALRTVILRDIDSTIREVEAYADDASLWRVVPGLSNSGGMLARHLAGNLHHFIGVRLGAASYTRNRTEEFTSRAEPPMSRAAVVAELRTAQAAVDAAMKVLDDAALGSEFPEPVAGHRVRTSRFLVHLAAHLGYHLGQIDYHRRMQPGSQGAAGTLPIDGLL